MKTNEFFDAMGKIDPALIERADRKATVKSKKLILKIAAIAASFALLITGLAVVLPMLIGDESPTIPQDAIVWGNVFNNIVLGKGSGWKIYEETSVIVESSFSEIEGKKYEKFKLGNCFPLESGPEYIGKKIDEITVRTGWYLHFEEKETDVVTVKAEVYEIKGVSPDTSVAIKYLEKGTATSTEHYYVAFNTEYRFTTLSVFLDDFNAAVHMNMGKDAYLSDYSPNLSGNSTKHRWNEGSGSDFIKLLFGFDAAAEIEGFYEEVDEKAAGCDTMLRCTFAMDSAGKTINFLYVLDNGYIAVQGFCDGYAFFNVGIEATNALFECFEMNSEVVKPTVIAPDGLVEATTSAPVNEIVPE